MISFIANHRRCFSADKRRGTVDFEPKQIIVSTEKQQLIFICTDASKSAEVSNHVKNHLQSEATIEKVNDTTVQITCDRSVANYRAAGELFEKLQSHIDGDLIYHLQPIRLQTECIGPGRTVDFIEISRAKAAGYLTIEDMEKLFRGSTIVNNGNINIGANNHIGDVNINTKEGKSMAARNWIAANPPNENESTTDYYKRYLTANPTGLNDKTFGPVVVAETRMKKIQTTGGQRVWRK